MLKIRSVRTDDHMNMAGHDTVPIYFQTFFQLAMIPTGYHNILVFVANEQVDPVYDSKTYKVKLVLIVEFIFRAHDRLKLHCKSCNSKLQKPLKRVTCQRGTRTQPAATALHSRA